jgi:hypothetical protein
MMNSDMPDTSRRRFITAASVSTAAALFAPQKLVAGDLGEAPNADASPASTAMTRNKSDTAVVFIDPQNDVLSEKGISWPLLHESLKENNTIENMESIFKVAKELGFEVFISPHYFFPTDKGWKFNGPLEAVEAATALPRLFPPATTGHQPNTLTGDGLSARSGPSLKRRAVGPAGSV